LLKIRLDGRSRLNFVAGGFTVPNIESRCKQLKLGHPPNVSALSERSRQKPVDSYRKLLVRFDERRVKYDFGELDEISLAYAVTIHKSRARSSQPWLSRSPP